MTNLSSEQHIEGNEREMRSNEDLPVLRASLHAGKEFEEQNQNNKHMYNCCVYELAVYWFPCT